MGDDEREKFWAELEATGEARVRAQFNHGQFGKMGNRPLWTAEWLALKAEASSREQSQTARSAKNAAWIAAIAAIAAAIAAVVTIFTSR